MNCITSGFPICRQFPEIAQTHVHRVSDAIQPSHPLSSPSPPAWIFSSIRVFSNESVLRIRWPKYWRFSYSIRLSNEYSGLISFRIDWFNLLAVQGILKSLLQHHSSKSINSSLLSFPYSPTLTSIHDYWKNHSFDKVNSLLFNTLSRLVIAFLSRRKCLLISWLLSPSALILEPPQNKVSHCFHCFPVYLPWSDGTRCRDLSFLNVEFKAKFFTFLFHFHQEGL